MKVMKTVMVIIAVLFLATGGPDAFGLEQDELDAAIRELSDYLNRRIPAGGKAVFLNVKSDYPDFSRYILDCLQENAVNDEVFSVVDRQQLDALRSELNFQWSGEVSDASAQEIGQMLGAQTIVSGLVSEVGNEYRIQVRAISVQTAAVQGMASKNVSKKEPIVTELTIKKMKKEEDSRKLQAASDYFFENSGISFSVRLGLTGLEHKTTKVTGGGDIELRLFRYFGLQTGFLIIPDLDEPKSGDKLLSEPLVTHTILQIPALVKIIFPFFSDAFYLSAYGGLGINLFPFSGNNIQSPSKYSFIIGGDLGFNYSSNLIAFIGFQFNRDLSETAYAFNNRNFRYLGQRSMMTFGISYFLPFRKNGY